MKTSYKGILFIFSILLLTTQSCKNKINENNQLIQITTEVDTVTVSPTSNILAKLKIQTIGKQEYISVCNATGVVKILSGHLAEISSPFEGRIVKSNVKLGQKITIGSPLFEVSSNDYFETVKMFLHSKQIKLLAEKNYQRKKNLFEQGVSSKKEIEEAESEFLIAQQEYEKTLATLNLFNVNIDKIDLSKPLIVHSPINGEIIKNNITVGQYQKTDAESVLTIADLDNVWVIASVKEKNIGLVNKNDKVKLFTESLPESAIEGYVDYIGNIIDEQTRSFEVYIQCNNNNRVLKPGMFINVAFEHKLEKAIILPSSAVLQNENISFVYVQLAANRFVKKHVKISSLKENEVIVYMGLEEGDKVVSEGGIYLQ